MMIKEWKHLIKLQRIRTEQMHQSEMLMFMKYKDFLLDNKNDIEKTDAVSKANNAKCIVNRSIKFCEKRDA